MRRQEPETKSLHHVSQSWLQPLDQQTLRQHRRALGVFYERPLVDDSGSAPLVRWIAALQECGDALLVILGGQQITEGRLQVSPQLVSPARPL